MAKELANILASIMSEENFDLGNKLVKKIGYEILKKHFSYDEKSYDVFFKNIEENPDKFEKFNRAVKFYYFWCKRPSIFKALKPDFKLIVMFSIIERIMSDEKYLTLEDWLLSTFSEKKIKIETKDELEDLLKKYREVYGSRKKIANFFQKYYEKNELEKLKESIKIYSKKENDFKDVKETSDLIYFIEGIRNKFIHRATDIQISSLEEYLKEAEEYTHYSSSKLAFVGDKTFEINNEKMHIEALLENFERALIRFFKKK